MTILKKLLQLGIKEEDINVRESKMLQRRLAHTLRQAAVNNLLEGKKMVAEAFRNAYQNIAKTGSKQDLGHEPNYKAFLKKQAKAGVMGTYIEAESLGEIFECNIVVTRVLAGKEQKKWCLYRASEKASPTVHLYCIDNNHWYSVTNKPKLTLGDGNCLYNAFAQELQKIVRQEQQEEKIISGKLRAHPDYLIFSSQDKEAVRHQQEILAAIKQSPTSEEVMKDIELNINRESLLSETEKRNLLLSYKVALQLAHEGLRESYKMSHS